MKSIKSYGRIINGEFHLAPNPVVFEGNVIGNPPEEVLLKLGYKKVVVSEQIPDLTGQMIKSIWIEKDDCIEQHISTFDPPLPVNVLLKEALDDSINQIRKIKDSVDRIHEYEATFLAQARRLTPEIGKVFDYYSKLTKNGTLDEVAALLFTKKENNSFEPTEEGRNILQNPNLDLGDRPPYYENDYDYIKHILVQFSFVQQRRDDLEVINYRMALCYLYSLLDDFTNKVFRTYFYLHPEKANNKLDLKTNAEVLSFTDISTLKEKIISDEMSHVPFNYFEKYNLLQKTLNFNQDPERKELRDDIIILCQERNVIIHKGGIVDKRFLEVANNTMYSQKYNENDSITVSYNYISKLISLVEEYCKALFDAIS